MTVSLSPEKKKKKEQKQKNSEIIKFGIFDDTVLLAKYIVANGWNVKFRKKQIKMKIHFIVYEMFKQQNQ